MESARQSRQKSQRTRLAEAITNGRLYQTKMILTDIKNLNYLDDEGLSPLMRAFMIEDIKHRTRSAMVKLLIHHKADVNLRDKSGLHVVNWACKMNKFDLVKLLVEKCLHDVDLTLQDREGNTPLIHAVISNNVDMVKFLVDALRKFSLSVDHRNREDKTAYLKALEMGYDECAGILSKVGNASQDIKVNPFLDVLILPNEETSRKIRVRSAPLAKQYSGTRQDSQHFMVNHKNLCVNDSLFDRKRVYFSRNKKRGSRLFKSRKIHSVVSQNAQGGNFKTISNKTTKRDKTQIGRTTNNDHGVKIFVGHEARESISRQNGVIGKIKQQKESFSTPKKETNSVPEKKDHFLRVLLDEPQSQSSTAQQSPRSSVSYTSCNQIVKDQSRNSLPTSPSSREKHKPVFNGHFTSHQQFRKNNQSVRKEFPDYHSYLVWKGSLDHPPNTLRSFLALRAEQQSERSSYRKGIVIPKYEPTSEDSVDYRSAGATSPVSERSSKSEAARKISAVAKTVGLSIYLTNKRKVSYRKDLDTKNSSKTMLNS